MDIKFKIDAHAEFYPCPHCAVPIALYQTKGGDLVVVDDQGYLHRGRCTLGREASGAIIAPLDLAGTFDDDGQGRLI